jgi:hypothetical protein
MALGTVNCSLLVTLGMSLLYQGYDPYKDLEEFGKQSLQALGVRWCGARHPLGGTQGTEVLFAWILEVEHLFKKTAFWVNPQLPSIAINIATVWHRFTLAYPLF